jgi:hypothetical protein
MCTDALLGHKRARALTVTRLVASHGGFIEHWRRNAWTSAGFEMVKGTDGERKFIFGRNPPFYAERIINICPA